MSCGRILKSLRSGVCSGVVNGIGYAGLAFGIVRDINFVQVMNEQFGHDCSSRFPAPGYICSDFSNFNASDDTISYVTASKNMFTDERSRNYVLIGFGVGFVVKTAITSIRAYLNSAPKVESEEKKVVPVKSKPLTILKSTVIGALQGYHYGFLSSLALFYVLREALPLGDPSAARGYKELYFRLYTKEAINYFDHAAPYLLAGTTIYYAGNKVINALWDELKPATQNYINEIKWGAIEGAWKGGLVGFFGGFFPSWDYQFVKLENENSIDCRMRFLAGVDCAVMPEYDDDALRFALAKSVKDGLVYNLPLFIMMCSVLNASRYAYSEWPKWQEAKREKLLTMMQYDENGVGTEVEYKPVPEVVLNIQEEIQQVTSPKKYCSPKIKEILEGAGKGFLGGTAIAYAGFYTTRFILTNTIERSKWPSLDASFRAANGSMIEYSDLAMLGVMGASTLFGAAYKRWKLRRVSDVQVEEHKQEPASQKLLTFRSLGR